MTSTFTVTFLTLRGYRHVLFFWELCAIMKTIRTFGLPCLLFLVYFVSKSSGFDKNKHVRGYTSDASLPKRENFGSGAITRREKRRKHGDTYSDLKKKVRAKEFLKHLQNKQNDSHFNAGIDTVMKRRKRYQYDEDYDWENGGMDYEDRLKPKKEESKFEKWAKNWQKNTLKFIFLFSFLMMLCCCCCACIKKLCSKTKGTICFHVREWRDLCLCRDPTYRRMRQMADEYGFELDYSMYKQIKQNYERGLEREGHGKFDLSGRT